MFKSEMALKKNECLLQLQDKNLHDKLTTISFMT